MENITNTTAMEAKEQTREELVLRVQESGAHLASLMDAERPDAGAIALAKSALNEHVKRLNKRELRDSCDAILACKEPVREFFRAPTFTRSTCAVKTKDGFSEVKMGQARERLPLVSLLARGNELKVSGVPSVSVVSGHARDVASEINACVETDFSQEGGGSIKRILVSLQGIFASLAMDSDVILRKADARFIKTLCVESARDIAHYRKATAEQVFRLLPDVVASIRGNGYIAEERG